MIDIKRAVTGNKFCYFSHYSGGSLFYRTEYGELFPVPLSDLGDTTIGVQEKAILLMRYMKQWNAIVIDEEEI